VKFQFILTFSQQIEEFKTILDHSIQYIKSKPSTHLIHDISSEIEEEEEEEEEGSILSQIDELLVEKAEQEKKIKSLTIHNEKLKNECLLLVSKNSEINKSLLEEIEIYKKKVSLYERKIKILENEDLVENNFEWIFDPTSAEHLEKEISIKNIKWLD
jgi:hypothetical protein